MLTLISKHQIVIYVSIYIMYTYYPLNCYNYEPMVEVWLSRLTQHQTEAIIICSQSNLFKAQFKPYSEPRRRNPQATGQRRKEVLYLMHFEHCRFTPVSAKLPMVIILSFEKLPSKLEIWFLASILFSSFLLIECK